MSEYLIQSETLDDIADAINAKTGGSSAMTPAEMATAISAIPSGSGGMSWELVADYTSDEDAALVIATIPEGKQNANIYKLEFSNSNSGGIGYYPKMRVSEVTSAYGLDAQSPRTCTGYIARCTPAGLSGEGSSVMFGNSNTNFYGAPYPITQIGVAAYGKDHAIKAGTRIRVWRLVES